MWDQRPAAGGEGAVAVEVGERVVGELGVRDEGLVVLARVRFGGVKREASTR